MEYLDPKKELRHRLVLFTGYICIAIAIVTAALVLVYQAYGFGLGKNGHVIQNGLTFFSSQPNPANIYINGTLNKAKTNARLVLPEGMYHVQLTRSGYRPWQRTIELNGGSVEHFDYPLLLPDTLTAKKVQSFTAAPSFISQSPDRRWLLVPSATGITNFEVYDLKTPAKTVTTISLPSTIITKATSGESWQLVEWAGDNQHVLLQHLYDTKTEYILLDRTNPDQSVNLSSSLNLGSTKLSLQDKKYDHYYIYDAADQELQTVALRAPTPVRVLQHVLAYQSYGSDTVLYVTDSGAPAGKALVKLTTGSSTYTIRSLPASPTYVLDLTKYSGTLYVATGAASSDKVYIYKDPVGQLQNLPKQSPVPTQVLHVPQPNYLSFSTNAQFIVAENGTQFGVYDIENKLGYAYVAHEALDAPQLHASWMDGNRLTYVTGGKLQIFDYDYTNRQTLTAANATYLPVFAPNYKYVYLVAPEAGSDQLELSQTALLAPADL